IGNFGLLRICIFWEQGIRSISARNTKRGKSLPLFFFSVYFRSFLFLPSPFQNGHWTFGRTIGSKGSGKGFCQNTFTSRSNRQGHSCEISIGTGPGDGAAWFYGNDGKPCLQRRGNGQCLLRTGDGRNLKNRCLRGCLYVRKQFFGLLGVGKIRYRSSKGK